MAVVDAAKAQQNAEKALRKAEDILRAMRRDAEAGSAEAVERAAKNLADVLKAREFPMQRATEYREKAKLIQRDAYQRSVENLIAKAETFARDNDDKQRNELLTKAKAHFGKALGYGAGDDYRQAVDRRVKTVLQTNAAGIDQKTKEAAARKTALDQSKSKAPGGIERRRTFRFSGPVMTAVIDGFRYQTINWSIRGLLLEGYRGELDIKVGSRLRIDLSCEDLPGAGRQLARVVRIGEPTGTLALEFPSISTVVLNLVRAMRDQGIPIDREQ